MPLSAEGVSHKRAYRLTAVDPPPPPYGHSLNINYRYQNFLELEDENLYDAVFLILGEFCPLDPQQRSMLLKNIYRALKLGGMFILDVTTREHRRKHGNKNRW